MEKKPAPGRRGPGNQFDKSLPTHDRLPRPHNQELDRHQSLVPIGVIAERIVRRLALLREVRDAA